MGNLVAFNNIASDDLEQDIDQVRAKTVRDNARKIYEGSMVGWGVMWAIFLLISLIRSHRRMAIHEGKLTFDYSYYLSLIVGIAVGFVILGIGAWQSSAETIGSYAAEKQEAMGLERNAFSLVVTLFALSSLVSSLRPDVIRTAVPFLVCTLFFSVVVVFAPVWVSTVDPVPTIEVKHIKSTSVAYALGFMAVALCLVITRATPPEPTPPLA